MYEIGNYVTGLDDVTLLRRLHTRACVRACVGARAECNRRAPVAEHMRDWSSRGRQTSVATSDHEHLATPRERTPHRRYTQTGMPQLSAVTSVSTVNQH